MKELNTFRQSLNENEGDKFYEVDFVEMEGNEVTRDFRHFTDENESKQFFNDLKDNPEIVKVVRNELFKGDGKNYLGGSEEREYSVNKETDLHRIFLNSRLGDKRFEEPESIMQFIKRKNQAREEFLSSPELNEGSYRVEYTTLDGEKAKSSIYNSKEEADKKEAKLVNSGIRKAKVVEVPKQINEFDDKSMKDYGDAMKVALGAQIRDAEEILDSGEADGMPLDNETEMLVRQELKRLKQMAGGDKKEKTMKFLKSKKSYRENLSLEEIYKDIMEVDKEEEKIRKKYDGMKRPSQDEVNDAFEKFERETHYLNNKPVGEWDAADMSNWKSILRKGGKLFTSVKESMARYRVSHTKKDSSKSSQDFIGGLNAEDEFYELMDNDDIISAQLEYIGRDVPEVEMTMTRNDDGEAIVKLASEKTFNTGK